MTMYFDGVGTWDRKYVFLECRGRATVTARVGRV